MMPRRIDHLPTEKLAPERCIGLGKAWAKNSINTAIYRGSGVLSSGGTQFGAFYPKENLIALFKRPASADQVEMHHLEVACNLRDAHDIISLGCDQDGFLHLCYASHSAPLHYRRSSFPWRIDAWDEETPMTGHLESRATYPYFLSGQGDDGRLAFIYRNGTAENGQIIIKHYQSKTGCWLDVPGPILTGLGFPFWSAGPYINHPAVGADGSMHLFFTWRTPLVAREGYVYNHNVDYACSPDWAIEWKASTDVPFTLPITPVSSETAFGTAPGDNLINQCSAAVDSKGRCYAVFYVNDGDGIPQYYMLWKGHKGWERQQIFEQHVPFSLTGRGTLKLPMSRPELVFDGQDRAWIIFVTRSLGGRLAAVSLDPPYDETANRRLWILWDEDLGAYEPVIDRHGFARTGRLTAYIQRVGQGNNEGIEDIEDSDGFLVDWKLA